jgi:hypothetical protein
MKECDVFRRVELYYLFERTCHLYEGRIERGEQKVILSAKENRLRNIVGRWRNVRFL